jgi:hypothetical protein
MRNQKRLLATVAGLGLVVALSSVQPAGAAVISCNFTDSAVTGVLTLAPGATAGAVAASNWQGVDVSPASGSSLSGVILSDGTGGTATLTSPHNGTAKNGLNNGYIASNNGSWSATTGTPEQALFNNWIQAPRSNTYTVELSLTNISYSNYSIYVYDIAQNSYNDSDSAEIFSNGVAGATYFMKDSAAWAPGSNLPTTYTQATGTTLATSTAGANYFLFTGLTGSTQAIDVSAGLGTSNDNGAISGIQIVQTAPEPASLALLALGGLLILPRRRRA